VLSFVAKIINTVFLLIQTKAQQNNNGKDLIITAQTCKTVLQKVKKYFDIFKYRKPELLWPPG